MKNGVFSGVFAIEGTGSIYRTFFLDLKGYENPRRGTSVRFFDTRLPKSVFVFSEKIRVVFFLNKFEAPQHAAFVLLISKCSKVINSKGISKSLLIQT